MNRFEIKNTTNVNPLQSARGCRVLTTSQKITTSMKKKISIFITIIRFSVKMR